MDGPRLGTNQSWTHLDWPGHGPSPHHLFLHIKTQEMNQKL